MGKIKRMYARKMKIQRLSIYMGKALPSFVTHLIYLMPIFVARFLLLILLIRAKVWARNSVYFKEEVFGLSDLDITFYFSKKVSSFRKKQILIVVKSLRFVFPFVGEVLFYEEDVLSHFMTYGSSLELARDPLLLESFRVDKINPLKKAFLLNWILNDYHRMKENPLLRKNKVRRFQQLSSMESISYIGAEDLLIDILKEFKIDADTQQIDWESLFSILNTFLFNRKVEKKSENDTLKSEPMITHHYLALCYPQLWMGSAIHLDLFEDTLSTIKAFVENKPVLLDTFFEQVSWEIWGLYTHFFQFDLSSEVTLHLDHLEQMLNIFKEDSRSSFLKRGIYKLRLLGEGELL